MNKEQRNRRLVYLLACMASFLLMSLIPQTADAQSGRVKEERLDMFVGEQKVISAAGVDKYSLGTSGIVDVRLPDDGIEFVLVALAAGDTTFLMIMKDGRQIRYNIVVRQVRVTERDNVRLDFYFVELSRDAGMRLGVSWPGALSASTSLNGAANLRRPRAVTAATAAVTSEVLLRLDFAQDSGWARVLREASVIVANGEQSVFESGGELNFRIESAQANSIQQIQFGSKVQVQPRYDRTTARLDLKISALVSELTDASVDGLPGRSFSNLDTLVNLELGQSIVLAGIHTKSSGWSREGLPYLSQIPVLGYLFGSRAYRESEVENLIFIIPTVVQAVSLDDRDRVKEAQETFRKFSGTVDGNALFRPGMPRPKHKQAGPVDEPKSSSKKRKRKGKGKR